MPRRTPAVPADTAHLRGLRARLADLPVPALLRMRDAVEAALALQTVTSAAVAAVLEAAAVRT
ncbi:MAG: hypothetical protein M3R48_05370 [Candidatus Dormibacteraeota bacterium]|nr:hypothetical protein [Candidatus Dormibacteraeota bacterium]